MASESRSLGSGLSATLADESRAVIAERGISRNVEVVSASAPPELSGRLGRALPAPPLAVAVDIYGTLLASAAGEVGPGADWGGNQGAAAFPPDTADRLRSIVAEDHARARDRGIPWPEVDAPSVFARALGLGPEDGYRACVAWECATNPCSAMPGAAEFLSACSERGLPLGVVSNAQFYTPLFLEAVYGAIGFDPDLVLWSYESGRAKPDRWMYDELARRLGGRGIPPERILYVGNDALNDCAAAGEAGFMTALFGGDAVSFKPRFGDRRALANPPSTFVLSWDDLRLLIF